MQMCSHEHTSHHPTHTESRMHANPIIPAILEDRTPRERSCGNSHGKQLLLLLKAIFYWFTSSSTWQTHTFNTISFLLLEYLSAVSPTPALFRWSIVREWSPLARIRMAREATAGKASTCQLSPRFRRPPLTTSPMVHPSTPNLTTNITESYEKMAGRERCLLCWSVGNSRLTLVVISRAIQVYLTL